MRSEVDILSDINADVPEGVNWRAGADAYVKYAFSRNGRDYTVVFSHAKPLNVSPTPNHLQTVQWYLCDFANTVRLMALPSNARWLDVACGGGWFAHYLTKLGYEACGVDLAQDFVDLAIDRIALDTQISLSRSDLAKRFARVDLESEGLPNSLGRFDAVVFESCVHHFYDPITAMRNAVASLKDDGIAIILEGENRRGPIRPEFLKVMRETSTLERPYPRKLLIEAMQAAGLAHYEFVAPMHGWFAPKVWNDPQILDHFHRESEAHNFCFAAKNAEALQRIFPWRTGHFAENLPYAP